MMFWASCSILKFLIISTTAFKWVLILGIYLFYAVSAVNMMASIIKARFTHKRVNLTLAIVTYVDYIIDILLFLWITSSQQDWETSDRFFGIILLILKKRTIYFSNLAMVISPTFCNSLTNYALIYLNRTRA